jgi:uncharacterized membrane protein YfcA
MFAALAGLAAGVLSAWGVGGGTLLILYMTALASVEQQSAQGINLLYFLPTSLTALIFHAKNKLIDKRAVISAALAGVPAAAASSLLAARVETGVSKKIFGWFVIAVGVMELFAKERRGD